MRILGIDPGIGRTGWAVIEKKSSNNIKPLEYGLIETFQKDSIEKRIVSIYDEIIDILRRTKPDSVVVEELFFGANTKTALNVGQARGAVLLAISKNNIDLAVYTPLQVKIAITGYGRAEKKQVEIMIKQLLKFDVKFEQDDISDAFAIALTHAYTIKTS